jgi:hypothetical protein
MNYKEAVRTAVLLKIEELLPEGWKPPEGVMCIAGTRIPKNTAPTVLVEEGLHVDKVYFTNTRLPSTGDTVVFVYRQPDNVYVTPINVLGDVSVEYLVDSV